MTSAAKPVYGELLKAIANNEIDLAMALLERGADPNEKDGNNKTALHLAITREYALELVKKLVEKGAGLETATTEGGYTPVMLAVHAHNIPGLLFLIEKGVDLTKEDKRGHTVLKWATLAGPGFSEVTKILEEAPLLRAEKKKIADLHDTAATRQDALTKRRPKVNVRPS